MSKDSANSKAPVKPDQPLPVGWCWATLREIAQLKGGFAKGKKRDSGTKLHDVPYLRVANVQRGYLDLSEMLTIEATRDEVHELQLMKGDVLFNEGGDRDKLGRGWIWNGELPLCIHQNHVFRARLLSQGISPKLVSWYSNSAGQRYFWDEGKHTTNLASVNLTKLGNFPVPVPPATEAESVVEALDSYLTRLDAATEGLKRVEANLKRYRASVLKAAVEGNLVPTEAELAKKEKREYEPASVLLERILKERRHRWEQAELAKMKAKGEVPKNDTWKKKYEEPSAPDTSDLPELPEGWCWASVDQLSLLIQYGTSAKTNEEADGVPVIRMGNIVDGYLTLESDTLKYLPRDHDELPSLFLETEDMLFNRTNSAELVGKSAVYMGVPKPCSFASYLIRVRFSQEIRAAYVAAYLNSLAGKQWVASVKNQQVGQANVNGSKLAACAIPVPPGAEQERIATELEKAASNIENLASGTARDVVRTERLRQSILRWAFEGKLVDQNPSDEPASALLERIRRERESSQPVKTPKPERVRRKTA